MVKRFFILTVALVLQYASVAHTAELDPTRRQCDLRELKLDLELARNQTGIPGMSVAVIHKGELVFAEGFGKRNKKDLFTPETRPMLASVTKAFTATTVAELVAEGKMDWDTTPVNTYLPEFETQDPVLTSQLTMQDLLSHRTPLPGFDTAWVWSNETRRDLIKRIRHVPVKPKLGVRVNYNNVMYCVTGEAAANVAGISLEQLVHNKIFRPLGYSSMDFSSREMSKSRNYATPYTATSYNDAVAGRLIELDPLDDGVEKSAAAGDMYSNVLDLARWGRTVMKGGVQNGKQVLSKEGVEATLTSHNIARPANRDPDFGLSVQYGMGWIWGVLWLHHQPGPVPECRPGDCALDKCTNDGLAPTASFHIADEILGLRKTHNWLTDISIEMTKNMYALMDEKAEGNFPDRVPNKPPAHALVEYAGEYDHPGIGTATVRLEAITCTLLLPLSKHTPEKMGRLVTFSNGPDGKVSGATFAVLEDEGYYYEKIKYSIVWTSHRTTTEAV
ncbi:hypothetical protein BGZ74_006882 [Mortierella antarctica]|nr:hypothetical protein BGZ74_006882 [Mortierella antarctica]